MNSASMNKGEASPFILVAVSDSGEYGTDFSHLLTEADSVSFVSDSPQSVLQTGQAHMPREVKPPFPPFDTQYFVSHLLWLAVCFGLFYVFMARVVLPRIGGAIEARHDRIASDLEQAERMKAEADNAVEAYQSSLNNAHEQAKSIAVSSLEEAKAKAVAERKNAESALEKKLRAAEDKVIGARNKALAEINTAAVDIAADILQKIGREKIDKKALLAAAETGEIVS